MVGAVGRSAWVWGADRSHHGGASLARYALASGRPAPARPRGCGERVIRTNLSTRPFYNGRAGHFWLLLVALAVVRATIFHVTRGLRHSRSGTELAPRAAPDETRAADRHPQAATRRPAA